MTAPARKQGPAIRVLLHVRYPAAFGLPERTVPVRLTLRDGFARNADQARRKILDLVSREQTFALDGLEKDEPLEFEPAQVVLVATWEEDF